MAIVKADFLHLLVRIKVLCVKLDKRGEKTKATALQKKKRKKMKNKTKEIRGCKNSFRSLEGKRKQQTFE